MDSKRWKTNQYLIYGFCWEHIQHFGNRQTATMLTSWKDCLTVGLLLFVMRELTCAFVIESQCFATCRRFQNEKFNNNCPKEGACDWQCAAQRMNCPGRYEYHCAREYGLPDTQHRFVNACAIPKQCSIGEEPAISFTNSRAEVICTPCIDKYYYNDRNNRMSSTFSQCPDEKWNHCTKENHKIDCGIERGKNAWNVQTEAEGFCRCDARGGYEPKHKDVFEIEGEYCFYKKVDCVKKDCGSEMELSLNYTCIPKCAEGLVRTQLLDNCSQIEISSSPSTPVSVLPTSTNRTESVNTSPNPPNRTAGTSTDGVEKYVAAGSVTITLVCIIGIIGYLVYRRRNKKEIYTNTTGVEIPLLPQPSKQENITIYNVQRDLVKIQNEGGNVNIRQYGDDRMTILAKKTGTASNERLEEDTHLFPSPRTSSSVPYLQKDHGSSTGSLESCSSAAGTVPSKPVLSKEGQDLRSSVPTEIPESVACHPTDDVVSISDGRDKLQERIPASINEKDFEPVNLRQRQGPDVDGDFTYVDEEATLDEKMEKLAEDLLNKTNIYLNDLSALNEEDFSASNEEDFSASNEEDFIAPNEEDFSASNEEDFSASNEEDLATIQSKLEKIPCYLKHIAEEKKVNLDKMLTFPMCVRKPPTGLKDLFKCEKCGKMFIRGNSSGKNNSCMYQSISLLLCGDERLQNRLRLCSTLHAVEWFKDYVKQLEAFAGKEENPLERVLKILCPAGVNSHDSKDWKVELRAGIMKIVVETSELNQDSSQLHIMFLSHALRCKITQHFEESSHHEDTEDCPVLENETAIPSDILDLHILWNKQCNHLMPLYKI